jgi:tetratricopeptide (TPR) repeat protein
MKAEERHELRENDMANWLHYGLWAFLKQNGSYFLLFIALVFLGYRLWVYYDVKQQVARQNAFNELAADSSQENFSSLKVLTLLPDLIDSCPFVDVKAQAALKLAGIYGTLAMQSDLLKSKDLTRASALSKSYEFYSKALELQGNDPFIAAKAHLGIAAVYEDQGEWDKAKTEYKTIIDGPLFAGTPEAEYARSCLASMDDRRNAPRLAAWTPPPTATTLPSSSGNTLKLPNIGTSLTPSGGSTILSPTGGSPFQGLMLGPPSPTTTPAASNPFKLDLSGPPSPATQPK